MTADERQRARDVLDLEEGRGAVPLLDDRGILELLRTARRIAVIGASSRASRPSNGVMATLLRSGYECIPVNPNEREVHGIEAYASLTAAVTATGPFDIVDVFRRADATPPIAEEAVATGCHALWLQLGIVNWEAARIASGGGLDVVMDRCTAIEVRRLR
jgi:predicted CoA-binding protein